jgi:hypothetical protein
MDDYSALAQRVAVTIGDVHGCLVLSRDGLVLGAFPEDESAVKPAWLRFATLGEPQKGFVEFGDQIWCYVHRGPYATFVVAAAGVRPGLLIDQMEQALLAAEEARIKREPLRVPETPQALSGKPRTSLHPPERAAPPAGVVAPEDRRAWVTSQGAVTPPPVVESPSAGFGGNGPGEVDASGSEAVAADQPDDGGHVGQPVADGGESNAPPAAAEAPAVGSALQREPQKLVGSGGEEEPDEDSEIDRVLLAKEFSGLLQMDSEGDEGSS